MSLQIYNDIIKAASIKVNNHMLKFGLPSKQCRTHRVKYILLHKYSLERRRFQFVMYVYLLSQTIKAYERKEIKKNGTTKVTICECCLLSERGAQNIQFNSSVVTHYGPSTINAVIFMQSGRICCSDRIRHICREWMMLFDDTRGTYRYRRNSPLTVTTTM